MPKKTAVSSCFYITGKNLVLFAADKDSPIELPLSSDIVKDQEIVSQPSLERVLSTWKEQFKLLNTEVILILDDSICFYNHLPQLPANNEDPGVKDFIDLVPFNEVWIEHFPVQDGAYTTAVNQRFLKPLITALEKVGFVVVGILPAFALGVDLAQTPFNKDIALQVLGNQALIDQYNFLSKDELEEKFDEPEPFMSFQLNAKIIGMAVAFIVLIGVLIALLKIQGMI